MSKPERDSAEDISEPTKTFSIEADPPQRITISYKDRRSGNTIEIPIPFEQTEFDAIEAGRAANDRLATRGHMVSGPERIYAANGSMAFPQPHQLQNRRETLRLLGLVVQAAQEGLDTFAGYSEYYEPNPQSVQDFTLLRNLPTHFIPHEVTKPSTQQ